MSYIVGVKDKTNQVADHNQIWTHFEKKTKTKKDQI